MLKEFYYYYYTIPSTSGGCCDGSAPVCFPVDDFFINETDVWLGQIAGADFYMSHDQIEYWRHTHITAVGITAPTS